MNRKQPSVVLAGLLALALAGCTSTKGSGDEMAGGATASGSGSSGAATTPQAGGTAATGGVDAGGATPPAQAPAMPGQAAMPTGAPNAVVMLIEAMPRPAATGAVGGSGTAGSTGSMGDEKVYRVTLRMDDGTTRVVTQDKAPTFRNGDRVNMMDGMISH